MFFSKNINLKCLSMAFIIQAEIVTHDVYWIQQSVRTSTSRLFFDKFIDVVLSAVLGC